MFEDTVESIESHRFNISTKVFELYVKFGSSLSWVPAAQLREDVPELTKSYLRQQNINEFGQNLTDLRAQAKREEENRVKNEKKRANRFMWKQLEKEQLDPKQMQQEVVTKLATSLTTNQPPPTEEVKQQPSSPKQERRPSPKKEAPKPS